jgi:membrane protein DedA with SNARE-associated domain/membrane-associated phospholipid phosphatase
MDAVLHALMDWTRANPNWAGLVVLLVSALESFLVVGLFVPGSIVMFGIGTLIAAGHMDLQSTLAWAALGAVLGDGTSYFIGRHYHQRLRVIWPFRRYPAMISRGVDFFHKHGGKSIVLARFVGPVRPLVPAVAGMLDMPPSRFFLVNVLSALLWAPAYILPGVLFGASLGLAAEVAGRLALLLVIILLLLWLSWWLVTHIARMFQVHAQALQMGILDWSRRHRHIQPLAAALLDPHHPEARGMTVLSMLLLAASWAFVMIPQHLPSGNLFGNLDLYLFNWLQNLRIPFADHLMVLVRQIGDPRLLYGFSASMSLWLLWRKQWRAALHWLITVSCVGVLTVLFKSVTEVERPPLPGNAELGYAFPSAHASLSVAVFGFLAVVVARELRSSLHWIPYTLAACLVVAISFSSLYLGAHWLSDVLAGWSLGLAWVALMGIAYRQHPAPPLPVALFAPLCVAALVLGTVLNGSLQYDRSVALYQPSAPMLEPLSRQHWLHGGWRSLPGFRDDLESQQHHPMNVQWLGRAADISARLHAQGWRSPRIASPESLTGLFNSKADIEKFPVLPQIHQGASQDLLLVHPLQDDPRLLALRLWRTAYRETDSDLPLWIGNVSYLYIERRLRLLRFLRTDVDFNAPLDALTGYLSAFASQRVGRRHSPAATTRVQWDGRTLLIYPSRSRLTVSSSANN